MNNLYQSDETIEEYNQKSLEKLTRAIQSNLQQSTLILVRCNFTSLRSRLMCNLQERFSGSLQELVLDYSSCNLYPAIDKLAQEKPQAVIVSGLESVKSIEQILKTINQARDKFIEEFLFPVVLWVTDEVQEKMLRVAPDFNSRTTSIEFIPKTNELLQFIQPVQRIVDNIFSKVLEGSTNRIGFTDKSVALDLNADSLTYTELKLVHQELEKRAINLELTHQASLEFLLGYLASSAQTSQQHYERSLAIWQQSCNLDKQGLVLYDLGCLYVLELWYPAYTKRQKDQQQSNLENAKDYFRQCIEVLEQADRDDLMAKIINVFGEVLRKLERWEELQILAEKALIIHQRYDEKFRLARANGFLAEVFNFKAKNNIVEAQKHDEKGNIRFAKNDKKSAEDCFLAMEKYAEEARSLLEIALRTVPTSSTADDNGQRVGLDIEYSFYQSLYLFLLAEAQRNTKKDDKSLDNLAKAFQYIDDKRHYGPELCIQILNSLHSGYFKIGDYKTAFEYKQKRSSVEQEFGLRPFTGASQLQPRQMVELTGSSGKPQKAISQEIIDSKRDIKITDLVERIISGSVKITVVYGQTGVGKSSILRAGLVPALQYKTLRSLVGEDFRNKPDIARDSLPILHSSSATDCLRNIGRTLKEELEHREIKPVADLDSPSLSQQELSTNILKQLIQNGEKHNLLTVLIFDQFEDLLLIYQDDQNLQTLQSSNEFPQVFGNFLKECLEQKYHHVRVVIAIQENYLHYLPRLGRLKYLEGINNDILKLERLYHLEDFTREEAGHLIKNLSEHNQFPLQNDLVDVLTGDLVGISGRVRPIELQILGTQLQAKKIDNLEDYKNYGKEKLLNQYIDEVISDCGPKCEQLAKECLYLLTESNNVRPLRTGDDLRKEIVITEYQAEDFDSVISILVGSGLVLLLQENLERQYQLAHDYFLSIVRTHLESKVSKETKLTKRQLIRKRELDNEWWLPNPIEPFSQSVESISSKIYEHLIEWISQDSSYMESQAQKLEEFIVNSKKILEEIESSKTWGISQVSETIQWFSQLASLRLDPLAHWINSFTDDLFSKGISKIAEFHVEKLRNQIEKTDRGLAKEVVVYSSIIDAIGGAVTGLGSIESVLITAPIDTLKALTIQVYIVCLVAHVYKKNPTKNDVFVILFSSDEQVLELFSGIAPGRAFGNKVKSGIAREGLQRIIQNAAENVLKNLLGKLIDKSVRKFLEKIVPFVFGATLGASVCWWETTQIGKRAILYYELMGDRVDTDLAS
ncbi:ATP-binding protein [Oculatella sp. LEGE 06141]|uniref:ATP-binding protein n=1 Tax=Oculatella sp. LEGE 06141 TaxID=1828648 RepID=UPI0018828D82|nr:ATP-binding protein [Oculatella sp. LEGE 06141]MBE9179349.1 ATP-binding protein [Oculatella sp. LEGE 06141]